MPEESRSFARTPVDRVFDDEAGRQWRATLRPSDDGSALEFSCLGDSREQQRVVAVAAGFSLPSATDDSLRELLTNAPRLGRLTE